VCRAFDEPDVAAIPFKEVEFSNQIEPVVNLLRVEPATASFLKSTEIVNLSRSLSFGGKTSERM